MSRNLDTLVAGALGWRNICWGDASTIIGNRPTDLAIDVVPAYSTNYMMLPEMLMWLEKRTCWRAGQIIGEGDYYAASDRDSINGECDANCRGDTLLEAVALLVVEVSRLDAQEKR